MNQEHPEKKPSLYIAKITFIDQDVCALGYKTSLEMPPRAKGPDSSASQQME